MKTSCYKLRQWQLTYVSKESIIGHGPWKVHSPSLLLMSEQVLIGNPTSVETKRRRQEVPCRTYLRSKLAFQILFSRLGFTVLTNFRLPGPRVFCTFSNFPNHPNHYPRTRERFAFKTRLKASVAKLPFYKDSGCCVWKQRQAGFHAASHKGRGTPKGVLNFIEHSVLESGKKNNKITRHT